MSKKTSYGYLREDDDGHWYLIPESEISIFRNMINEINSNPLDEERLTDEFIERFDQYRLSGGVGDLKIPIDVKE